ncbi:MAG: hypothetical protein KAH48_12560 [Chlorobi bacterium]|nr:hypothetical protein [Chlorobiota bacterium]
MFLRWDIFETNSIHSLMMPECRAEIDSTEEAEARQEPDSKGELESIEE